MRANRTPRGVHFAPFLSCRPKNVIKQSLSKSMRNFEKELTQNRVSDELAMEKKARVENIMRHDVQITLAHSLT